MSEEIEPATFTIVAFFLILLGSCITFIVWIRIMNSVHAELYLLYFIGLVNFIYTIFSIIFTLFNYIYLFDLEPLFTFLEFMLGMKFEYDILLISFFFIGLGLLLLFVASIITSRLKEKKLFPKIFIWFLFILSITTLSLCIIGVNEVKISIINVKNLQILSYFSFVIDETLSIFSEYLSLFIILGVSNSAPMNIGLKSLIILNILLIIGTIYLDRLYKSFNSRDSKEVIIKGE